MKKKIIFGTLLVVFVMMTLPTAYAAESSTVKGAMKSQIPIILPDIDIEELKLKYQNGPEPTFFLIFILKQILNILRTIKFAALFAALFAIIQRIFGNTTTIII